MVSVEWKSDWEWELKGQTVFYSDMHVALLHASSRLFLNKLWILARLVGRISNIGLAFRVLCVWMFLVFCCVFCSCASLFACSYSFLSKPAESKWNVCKAGHETIFELVCKCSSLPFSNFWVQRKCIYMMQAIRLVLVAEKPFCFSKETSSSGLQLHYKIQWPCMLMKCSEY